MWARLSSACQCSNFTPVAASYIDASAQFSGLPHLPLTQTISRHTPSVSVALSAPHTPNYSSHQSLDAMLCSFPTPGFSPPAVSLVGSSHATQLPLPYPTPPPPPPHPHLPTPLPPPFPPPLSSQPPTTVFFHSTSAIPHPLPVLPPISPLPCCSGTQWPLVFGTSSNNQLPPPPPPVSSLVSRCKG